MREHVKRSVADYIREQDAISKTPTPQGVILRIQKDVLDSLQAISQQGSTQRYINICLLQLGLEPNDKNGVILLELLLKVSLEFRNNAAAMNAVSLASDLIIEAKTELISIESELIKILVDSPDRNEIFTRIESLLKTTEQPCTRTTPPPQSTSEN